MRMRVKKHVCVQKHIPSVKKHPLAWLWVALCVLILLESRVCDWTERLAAEKSSHQAKSNTCDVYCSAISFVLSEEPVSAIRISSMIPEIGFRILSSTASSFFTIIHRLREIIFQDPSDFYNIYAVPVSPMPSVSVQLLLSDKAELILISPTVVYPLYVLHNNQPHSVPLSHHIHTGIL